MKKLIIWALLLSAFSVHASDYQIHCSDGLGTIKWIQGNHEQSLSVTQRLATPEGLQDLRVNLNLAEIIIQSSHTTIINNTTTSGCHVVGVDGVSTWQETSVKKITIRKKDGAAFTNDIVGVSPDARSITAYVLCEERGNSEALCQ